MTREEWKNYKEFDELSRDMNGLYSELPSAPQILAGSIEALNANNTAEQKERERKAPYLFPPSPPWERINLL